MYSNIRSVVCVALAAMASLSMEAADVKVGVNYNIVSSGSGLAIDNQESFSPGSKLCLSKFSADKPSQVWQFVEAGNGYYCITSPLSLMGIDNGGNPSEGKATIQWSLDKGNRNQL
ncbi:MAG: RICIN domain-containing protein, partial [Muribaculaceae bacterium]|nr:RICIN domain-containing protein [Muribaculaceae bacterium]